MCVYGGLQIYFGSYHNLVKCLKLISSFDPLFCKALKKECQKNSPERRHRRMYYSL